ncbi:MAG: AAA family ATPase [Synergistaceae bacterium]|nr:AAA family ATPase [Synergistaceae bacterium]
MSICLRLAFYGKGGIGKSAIASNVAAAFAILGRKVLLIGCDPKADATRNLTRKTIPTVIDTLDRWGELTDATKLLHRGAFGVTCVESGGPEAGVGCAGLGISSTLEELERLKVYDMDWDVVIYDVLGDVVCGGFSVPMRETHIDKVYVVTSAEFMSLYAANNILKGVRRYSSIQTPLLGGILHNRANSDSEISIVGDFCKKTNTSYFFAVRHYPEIGKAELRRKTVLEAFPDSPAGRCFVQLAERLSASDDATHPSPLPSEEMDVVGESVLEYLHTVET